MNICFVKTRIIFIITCTRLSMQIRKCIILKVIANFISFYQRHTFARFGATLATLDLHESGIQTCDAQAFVGLTNLKKLMLWGNKLTYVPEVWFANMQSLQTLDLSFNFIQGIDYTIFYALSNLENFYFDYNQLRYIDYNMFAYLGKLKKVKFSMNPWNWP